MIRGMTCHENSTFAATTLILAVAGFLTGPTPLSARARNECPLAHQSTPEINLRVYSCLGFPPGAPGRINRSHARATRRADSITAPKASADLTPSANPKRKGNENYEVHKH